MNKRCICGKVITSKYDLCANCMAEYGKDRSEWPDWLKFMVADMRRERRQDIKVSQHEISFTDLGIYD